MYIIFFEFKVFKKKFSNDRTAYHNKFEANLINCAICIRFLYMYRQNRKMNQPKVSAFDKLSTSYNFFNYKNTKHLKLKFIVVDYFQDLKFLKKLHFKPRLDAIIHSCPKLKLRPFLPFSSFVHKSSINEYKNMKLRENICYEMIYRIFYYWGFGSNL